MDFQSRFDESTCTREQQQVHSFVSASYTMEIEHGQEPNCSTSSWLPHKRVTTCEEQEEEMNDNQCKENYFNYF